MTSPPWSEMCYSLWEAVEQHRDIMLHLSAVILKLCNNLAPQWSNAHIFKIRTQFHATALTHGQTDTHMPKGALTWDLCNQAPSLPVFSPLPTPICLLGLTWWAWCHFPFLSLKNRRTKSGLCALMWAIAKCFYNDVMLLLCSPPAPLPLLLHHLDSLAPSGEATHKCKHKQKKSVHNGKKKDKWMMAVAQPRCAYKKKNTKQHLETKGQLFSFAGNTHIVQLLTFAYRGTLESPINQCFCSVGGNQEKTHAVWKTGQPLLKCPKYNMQPSTENANNFPENLSLRIIRSEISLDL